MANRRFIDFPIAASVGNNDIVLIWQDGLNKQTTKATLLQGSPQSLAGLTDVDIAGLINGQILQYNSTTSKWENVDRTDINLSQLGDVTIVAPANGQVLVYNSSTGKWENSSAGYVPYTGAVTTVNLGAQSILAGSFVKAGGTAAQFLKANGSVDSTAYGTGTVTSVALTMPSAFSVGGSPITTAGTLAVTGAGTVGQYIRGDGSLATFPATTGGGSSVTYYLNGSVSQGTIGGVAYREVNRTPIFGTGTDISTSSNGYIANFITDAGDPNKLLIPAGNWNLETYFSANNGGGSPTFYVELYKYNGTTFTLIATSSGTPELIAFGTNINPYFTTLAVPETVLALTDRLALRYYVNTSGRTITLHTENGHLCQIITTFTTGLTALNGLTSQVQFFAVGTSGTDFAISSATDTHTFNLPTASATNRGALSSADWTTFNNKTSNLGTVTSVGLSSATSGVTIGSSPITTSGTITLAIATASGSQNGLLSSTDWSTFNAKIGGTLATGQVAFGTAANTVGGSNNLFWDNVNGFLGVGTSSTLDEKLTVLGNIHVDGSGSGIGTFGPFVEIGRSNGPKIQATQEGADNDIQGLAFFTKNSTVTADNPTERWRISSSGVLQSNGAQTIQTSTGELTLATGGGNGNIVLSPNGTGGVGIGTTSLTTYSLRVSKNITGAVTSYGITSDGIIQSGVTSNGFYYSTLASTAAVSFTVNNIVHYFASQGTFGAGSTVTNQYGFFAAASLVGATNDFGFYGDIASGTGRWNLYMNGTANNYLAGNLLVGTTTDQGQRLLVQGTGGTTGFTRFTDGVTAAMFIGINSGTPFIHSNNSTLSFGASGANTFSPTMTLSSGNVGIGTTSPSTKLDVRISDATTYTTSSTGNTLTLYNTSTTTNAFVGIDFLGEPTSGNAGRAAINMITVGSGNGDLAFSTRGSAVLGERMRITSGGNVLIGTTSTQAGTRLLVAGVTDIWSRANTLLRLNHDGVRSVIESFTDGGYSPISISPNGGNVLIGTTTDTGDKLQVNGAIKTSAPSGGTAGSWKFGTATSGIVTIGGRIRVEINGVAYDILTT